MGIHGQTLLANSHIQNSQIYFPNESIIEEPVFHVSIEILVFQNHFMLLQLYFIQIHSLLLFVSVRQTHKHYYSLLNLFYLRKEELGKRSHLEFLAYELAVNVPDLSVNVLSAQLQFGNQLVVLVQKKLRVQIRLKIIKPFLVARGQVLVNKQIVLYDIFVEKSKIGSVFSTISLQNS